MTFPSPLDVGIQKLLKDATSVPVAKSAHLPSVDLLTAPLGYVFFDISETLSQHSSEGLGESTTKETQLFQLDIACAANDNTRRKVLTTEILAVTQPIVSGRRTQLTSYLIPGTGVFINYMRLESQTETGVLKAGQSQPDISMLVLSFSCKATC